ncbi:MAG: hypothetical protein J6U47_04365, partial [Bacteroidales bacterium]|nr:hypothetical protein [Bacteroidales bacterium]
MAEIKKAYTLLAGNQIFALDCPKVEHSGDATIAPNVYNSFGTIGGALTVTKGNEKPNVLNIYMLKVTASDNFSIVFSGWEVNWFGGEAPVF